MSGQVKNVVFRGPALTHSGYGVHARQIIKWLLSHKNLNVKFQTLPWGTTPWLVDRNAHDGLAGRIMENSIDSNVGNFDVSLQLQLPNEWDPRLANFNVGLTAGVETDRCNPVWIDNCNRMDRIVVPSTHVEKCFRNTGNVTTQIDVIPESFPDALLTNDETGIDKVQFSTPFNFLFVGQLTGNNPENDRKNMFYCIKWFCETFSNDPEVGLVIKTNAGRNTSLDNRTVTQMLTRLLGEVRKNSFPKIHVLHGTMSDAEMSSLYRHRQVKALLAPTRGEGFGLPILEAAASGLPVIATGWSGHVDFLSHGKYISLGYRLSTVHPSRVDGQIFVPESMWAQPDENDFKNRLLKFRKSPELPLEWAQELKGKIVERYSQGSIEEIYEKKLGDLL